MLSRTLLVGALAAVATAQSSALYFTDVPNPVTVGEPAVIGWTSNDTNTPVSLILKQGPNNNLQTIATLTTDAATVFRWIPSTSLPNGNDYVLEIKQASRVNYFGPFTVQNSSQSASTSRSTSTLQPTGTSLSSTSTTRTTNTPPDTSATLRSSTAASTLSPAISTSNTPSSSTNEGGISSTTSTSKQSEDSLDTGAAVGIGVGATLGVVALVLAAWILWRRKKKTKARRSSDLGAEAEAVSVQPSKPEKDGVERFEAPNTGRMPEAGDNARAELEGGYQAAELDGGTSREA